MDGAERGFVRVRGAIVLGAEVVSELVRAWSERGVVGWMAEQPRTGGWAGRGAGLIDSWSALRVLATVAEPWPRMTRVRFGLRPVADCPLVVFG